MNLSRHLLVRCFTRRRAREWTDALMEAAKTTARDFTQQNRYDSFAPVRSNNECRWYFLPTSFLVYILTFETL